MLSSKNMKQAIFIVMAVAFLLVTLGYAAFSTVEYENRRLETNGAQTQNELGAVPVAFEPVKGLRLDNKTQVVFLYYTTCPACEESKNLFITRSYPTWQGNLTSDEVSFGAVNYYRKKDVGDAYFKAFNISSQAGGSVLVAHNSMMGLVYYPPLKDMDVQKGVYYLTRGSMAETSQESSEVRFSQPLIYALGAVSGFNPCLVALASFFFATATQTELRGVAKRIGLISLGLVYSYIVLFSLIVSNPTATSTLASLTWLIVFILVVMALLHFIEVGQDVYSRRWGSGSSIEAKVPLFRTPKPLKGLLVRVRELNSPVYDFALGAVFSLIKLPCIAAFLVVMLVNSTTPLADVTIFTLGVASPIILMGILIGLGMVKVNRLSTIQFKGRLIQRIVIGAALLMSAILVIP